MVDPRLVIPWRVAQDFADDLGIDLVKVAAELVAAGLWVPCEGGWTYPPDIAADIAEMIRAEG